MGDDEARARATLNEMQLRISEGPYTALGIAQTAPPEQVRAAFLALTKQFHPARFGRMSGELQRLSNEVFLGIKNSHDQLMKQLGGARRAGASQSGAIPVARTTTPSQGMAPPPTTPAQGISARPAASPSGARPGVAQPMRPGTPPVAARPATPQPTTPARPTTPAAPTAPAPPTTPPLGTPIQRPGTPPTMRPMTSVARPATRPAAPPAPGNYNPDTIRHSGVPAFDERTAHREAMISLNEQDWSKARHTLQQLAQHRPQSKNYAALLAYARGREAQGAGRAAEAAHEYQRALEHEPDLAMAKQALADLQRRR